MDLGYAGIIITAIAGVSGTVITALIRLPGRSTNGVTKKLGGMSERLGKVEQAQAATEASTEAHYQEILRRLDRIEDKIE